jgi:hypothetical protein
MIELLDDDSFIIWDEEDNKHENTNVLNEHLLT